MMGELDAEQLRLMEEACILVTPEDEELGPVTKKECHLWSNIQNGMLHRAFSVFLFSPDGKLLLQQRADAKITFPGAFTNTCCSHPLYLTQERPLKEEMGLRRAIQRKLNHELGIPTSQISLDKLQYLTRIHYKAPCDGGLWGEHEIDYIFVYQGSVDLALNENEVKSVLYVTKEELKELFAQADLGQVVLTPWFKLIVDRFLYSWWDKLDALESFQDKKTIHRL